MLPGRLGSVAGRDSKGKKFRYDCSIYPGIIDPVIRTYIRICTVLFAAMALGQVSISLAEEGPANVWMEQDRSAIQVGAYFANFDTKIRLSPGPAESGTIVDAEGDFGLDDSSANLFFHADYRFRHRHRIDFAFYDLSRDGSNVIERDIEFGDVTFPVGATVNTKFDYQIAKLTYSYSLLQNQKVDLAVAAGIYTAFFDFRSTDIETGATEGEDGTVPVPVFGLRGAFLINSRWMANAYLEYFEIDNSDVAATYIDTTVSLDYRVRERTGIGFAYNFVNVDGEDKGSDDAVDFDYDGLLLYVFYNFR